MTINTKMISMERMKSRGIRRKGGTGQEGIRKNKDINCVVLSRWFAKRRRRNIYAEIIKR